VNARVKVNHTWCRGNERTKYVTRSLPNSRAWTPTQKFPIARKFRSTRRNTNCTTVRVAAQDRSYSRTKKWKSRRKTKRGDGPSNTNAIWRKEPYLWHVTNQPLQPRGIATAIHCIWDWVRFRSILDVYGGETNHLLQPQIEPKFIGRPVRRLVIIPMCPVVFQTVIWRKTKGESRPQAKDNLQNTEDVTTKPQSEM
jgi:hypothetical protein